MSKNLKMTQYAYSVGNLATHKTFRDVDSSAQAVRAFYISTNLKREKVFQFVLGDHYTIDEKMKMSETGRVPVVMNQFPASLRTVLGLFLESMFDVSFVPVGVEDTGIAEVLEKLAIHESNRNDDTLQDAQMALLCWIGADGNRMNRPETAPLRMPWISSTVMNPFAVCWDPNSRDLVRRTDANFFDSYVWMSLEDVLNAYPEAKQFIHDRFLEENTIGAESYEFYSKATDRGHESRNERNGVFLVIERYYRVNRMVSVALDANDDMVEVENPKEYLALNPGVQLTQISKEFLYVAIWAPGLMKEDKFLYNGPWHAQPRDPITEKIIWPMCEAVAGNINGQAVGFAESLMDPNKLIDVLMTSFIESAKHAPSGYEIDPSKYLNSKEAARAKRLGAHANQRYEMKPGEAGNGMKPIEKANGTIGDHHTALEAARQNFFEQSSTPPPMQGLNADNPSGVLNQQRIDQATRQLNEFIAYFRQYRKQTLRLRYAYWREFYTDEMVFRITTGPKKSEVVTVNQEVPAVDQFGRRIPGQTMKINDLQSAMYDVILVDSTKSPSFRMKQMMMVQKIIESGVANDDPILKQKLVAYLGRLSDDSELQEIFDEHANQMEQARIAQQQMVPPQVPGGVAGAAVPFGAEQVA